MKKIIRTRTITKTSRRMVVCHENLARTTENTADAPVLCPNCGEPIVLPMALMLPAAQAADNPELSAGSLETGEARDEEN